LERRELVAKGFGMIERQEPSRREYASAFLDLPEEQTDGQILLRDGHLRRAGCGPKPDQAQKQETASV
jgi:hypothetical protein